MNGADFSIRKAGFPDIPKMCELLCDLFSIEADFLADTRKQARGLELLINDNSGSKAVFVAETDDSVIGMCTVQTLVSTAEGGVAGVIEDLVVRKDQRCKGVGKGLLSHALAHCAAKGLTRVQLLRDAENSRALDFYARNGWSSTSLVCMRKFL